MALTKSDLVKIIQKAGKEVAKENSQTGISKQEKALLEKLDKNG